MRYPCWTLEQQEVTTPVEPQDYAELQVSADKFKEYVQDLGSYRTFADDSTALLQKQRRDRARRRRSAIRDDEPGSISHSLISQLANGITRNTHPDRARAISKMLGRDDLFVVRSSNLRPPVRKTS